MGVGGTGWIGPAVRTGVGLYSAYSATRTNTTRRRSTENNMTGTGMTYRRKRYKVGRKKTRSLRQLFNSQIGQGSSVVLRWQQISNSLLLPGRLSLGWQISSSPENEWVPMHFMSLTQTPIGVPNSALGCFDTGIKKLFFNTNNGSWSYSELLTSQDSKGDTTSGQYRVETNNGVDLPTAFANKIYHSWTEVRFNLYGARATPLTYNIYVLQMKEQVDPQSAMIHSQGSECANMLKDMLRPLVGNPINTNGRIDWPRDVRIVKKIVKTIQPLSYSDQASAAYNVTTSTSHVEQVKLFLRHDRMRDYKWHQRAADTNADNTTVTQGWDQVQASDNISDLEWGKKLYLFITCTSSRREAFDGNNQYFADGDPNWSLCQGSYDIIIRNKFAVM